MKTAKPTKIIYPAGSEKELALFEKIKLFTTKQQWLQFLKSLNLFSNDIVTRPELIRMCYDILGEKGIELIDKFKLLIGYDEIEEKNLLTQQQQNYYIFVSSVDFTTCNQVTPSYRELPSAIAIPHCSGR
jgi:histone deacetylase complex regulatory component SIN3